MSDKPTFQELFDEAVEKGLTSFALDLDHDLQPLGLIPLDEGLITLSPNVQVFTADHDSFNKCPKCIHAKVIKNQTPCNRCIRNPQDKLRLRTMRFEDHFVESI